MKRYVEELASDFRKDYNKKCKEYPNLLPAGFLREVNKICSCTERGIVSNREAVKNIVDIWYKLDDWIFENQDKNAIKL